jgi:acyl-CoA synthetase (AMP-forming)/AMP-acid ligase II
VLTGGAPVPVVLMRQFFERFPRSVLIQVFGLTEGPLITTFLAPEDSERKVGSIGKPAPGVEVMLVTADDNRAATGEVGEIVGRSPGVVRGYWGKPEATRETFRDGWCHTGDLGYVDEEGFYYIVGRKKDMIISGAENIYPIEVEQALAGHPAVAEAAVVGVPDARWGEAVKAFIVLKAGMQCTEEELIAFCKTRLASYKKPRHVEFVAALPRNASGKVLKQHLLKTEAPLR